MSKTETDAQLSRLATSFASLATEASGLSDEDLDKQIPGYGGRPTPVRGLLYAAANHAREHVNHVNKILGATGAAPQTEAQAILAQTAQALGALEGVLTRVSDDDLSRSHEDQTISAVLEHVSGSQESFANYLREGLK